MITPPPPARAFEVVVRERVVLDLDREALDCRVHRRALRHRPGAHRPVDLEPDVEVVRRRLMLLDDKRAGDYAADRELLVAFDAHVAFADRAKLPQRA